MAHDDFDRDAILERRRRFVAAAMAGLATAATAAVACTPQACLEPTITGTAADASSERVRADATAVPDDASVTDASAKDDATTDADAKADGAPSPSDAGDGGG